MQLKDCYYLGTITRPHGLKGHLVAKLDTDVPELYSNMESVFLNINGMLVPFFVKECQLLNKDSLKIKLEDNSTSIENLIGCDMYLPMNTLPKLIGKQFYYHEVISFNITNEKQESIGKILEINDIGTQALFNVQIDENKNIYIPIINEWIIEVNREKKMISMNLPEGILDL